MKFGPEHNDNIYINFAILLKKWLSKNNINCTRSLTKIENKNLDC